MTILRMRPKRLTGTAFDQLLLLAEECQLVVRCGLAHWPGCNSPEPWLGLYPDEPVKPVYRYAFARWWGKANLESTIAWVLLNPSTGDTDLHPRPLLTSLRHRSKACGYSGLVIMNLFALRSRNPKKLLQQPTAIGPQNDRVLGEISHVCPLTVAAWGNDGVKWGRAAEVRKLLREPECMRKNGRDVSLLGQPFHPRGVRLDAERVHLPKQPEDSPEIFQPMDKTDRLAPGQHIVTFVKAASASLGDVEPYRND